MNKRTRIGLLWVLLCLPALGMLGGWVTGRATAEALLHPTGEFSVRLLILTLVATPLQLLLPRYRLPRWLLRNRRYLGVASFGYALLHTAFYLLHEGWVGAGVEFTRPALLTGWLAFFIYVPLAVTSTDGFVRRMGKAWKKLQNWTHVAAVLVLLHWVLLEYAVLPALVHFLPVALLQAYRIFRRRTDAAGKELRR